MSPSPCPHADISLVWLGPSVPYPVAHHPLPRLCSLAFHIYLATLSLGKTGNGDKHVDFALRKPKILWLLGAAYTGGREGIVNNKSFSVINNHLKDHTCNLRKVVSKNKVLTA